MLPSKLLQKVRKFKLQFSGATVGENPILSAAIVARRGIYMGKAGVLTLADNLMIREGVILDAWGGSIAISSNTFIGPYTIIYGHGGVEIGSDCLISEHCSIHSANHALPAPDRCIRWEDDIRKKTVIHDDVWIGAGAKILAGVTIGKGSVIGAGAVVTKDVEPYSICTGVPARKTGMRDIALIK